MIGVDLASESDKTVATIWVGGKCLGEIKGCDYTIYKRETPRYKVETPRYKVETPRGGYLIGDFCQGTGAFKIRNLKKFTYEIFELKNEYYKHLKRVKNRKKLTEKLKKRGRK